MHHLKKGGWGQRLQNDLMRGSGVFGAADSVLMLKSSETDKTERVTKSTKQRNAFDEHKDPHLLSLDPECLWFNNLGPVNEADQLAALPLDATEIDFKEIFDRKQELQMREKVRACSSLEQTTETFSHQTSAVVRHVPYLVLSRDAIAFHV